MNFHVRFPQSIYIIHSIKEYKVCKRRYFGKNYIFVKISNVNEISIPTQSNTILYPCRG